jgi:integrase
MAFGRVVSRRVHGEQRFLVEWRDAFGKRKSKFYDSAAEAEAKQSEVNGKAAHSLVPKGGARSLATYAAYWLKANKPLWAPNSWQAYEIVMRCHILPFQLPDGRMLGDVALSELTRADVKAFVQEKRAAGYAALSVRAMFAALRTMLNEATEEEAIPANPLGVTGKNIRKFLTPPAENVKAMDEGQAARFLHAAADSPLYGLFLAGFDQGLRLAELRAWAFDNLNLDAGVGTVAHQLCENARVLGPTKGKRSRIVELTNRVRAFAKKALADRPALALAQGWRPVPGWLFVAPDGAAYPQRTVQREFARILTAAKLDGLDFSPHTMRHTFACLHLAHARDRNVIQWVQQQLGHSSIKITVDTYGAAIRLHDPAAADRLELLCGRVGDANGANRG